MISFNTEVLRMQQAFRQVLDAFARPGTLHTLPLPVGEDPIPGLTRSFDTAVRLLVDQGVTFSCPGCPELEQAIVFATRSRAVPVSQAAFVLVPAIARVGALQAAFSQASGGQLISPEKGATLIVACGDLSTAPSPGLRQLDISGPGVQGVRSVFMSDVSWAQARNARAFEYPCGVDVLLVQEGGTVLAVPRTSRVEVRNGEGGVSWAM